MDDVDHPDCSVQSAESLLADIDLREEKIREAKELLKDYNEEINCRDYYET